MPDVFLNAESLFRKRSGSRVSLPCVDFQIAHALNHFAVGHDGFEDVLLVYVKASEYLFLALVAVLGIVGLQRHGMRLSHNAGVLAGASAALGLLIGMGISKLADRARPFLTHPSIHDFLHHAPDPGMPSDHATAAFAIAVALLLVHRRAGMVALAAAVILALGRVALGVHYLSDVAVGALLGTLSAILVAAVAARVQPRQVAS